MKSLTYNGMQLVAAGYALKAAHVVFRELFDAKLETIRDFNNKMPNAHYDAADEQRSDTDKQCFRHCLDFCLLEVARGQHIQNLIANTKVYRQAQNEGLKLIDLGSNNVVDK